MLVTILEKEITKTHWHTANIFVLTDIGASILLHMGQRWFDLSRWLSHTTSLNSSSDINPAHFWQR